MLALQNMSVSTATILHIRPGENISTAAAANGLTLLGAELDETLIQGPGKGMRLLLYISTGSHVTARKPNSTHSDDNATSSADGDSGQEPGNESSWLPGPWQFVSRDADAVHAHVRITSDTKDTKGFDGGWGERLSTSAVWLYSTPSQIVASLPEDSSYFNTVTESIFVTVSGRLFLPGCLGSTTATFRVLTASRQLHEVASVNDVGSVTSAGLTTMLTILSAGEGMSTDMQNLAMISLMRCGNNAQRASTSTMRFMLSPFYDLGPQAAVLWGIVTSLAAMAVATLATAWQRRRFPEDSGVPWLQCEASRSLWFPRVPYTIAAMLFCGVAQFSFNGFSQDNGSVSDGLSVAVSAVGVLYCCFFLAAAVLVPRRLVEATVVFDDYRKSPLVQALSPGKQRLILSVLGLEGRWGPRSQIHRFAPFFSSMPRARLGEGWVPHVLSFVVALVTSMPVRRSRCGGVFVTLAAFFALASALHIVALRSRSRLLSHVQGAVHGTMAFLAAIGAWNAFAPTPTSALALSVITSTQVFLALLASVIRLAVFVVELRLLPRSIEDEKQRGRSHSNFNFGDFNLSELDELEEILLGSDRHGTEERQDSELSLSSSADETHADPFADVRQAASDRDEESDETRKSGEGAIDDSPDRVAEDHEGDVSRPPMMNEARLQWYRQLQHELSRSYNPMLEGSRVLPQARPQGQGGRVLQGAPESGRSSDSEVSI
jgi:hypothetical protein